VFHPMGPRLLSTHWRNRSGNIAIYSDLTNKPFP
jgi:hypothetical protein